MTGFGVKQLNTEHIFVTLHHEMSHKSPTMEIEILEGLIFSFHNAQTLTRVHYLHVPQLKICILLKNPKIVCFQNCQYFGPKKNTLIAAPTI